MPRRLRLAPQLLVLSLAAACGERATAPDAADQPLQVDPVRGRAAFVTACASCHASGDGYDLAFFHFADTITIRRALKHVDSLTARDIAAYVHSLAVTPSSPQERLFQPGGAPVEGDAAFGRELFGADAWPADMTTARLRAMDPRQVRVAVALPLWAVETDETDWMPDVPLAGSVRADRDSTVVHALAAYRQLPSDANLSTTAAALLSAMERKDSNGPCHFEGGGRFDAEECFQSARWASSLVAQHMLRTGSKNPMADSVMHDLWWEVGDAARRGFNIGLRTTTGRQNWTSWMYLAWSFGPDHHPTFYFLQGLQAVGLSRHAVWAGMRSMVARPVGSALPYDDLVNVEKYGATAWLYEAERFGMNHLLERLRAGDRPPASGIATARSKVDQASREAGAKLSAAQRDALAALAQEVMQALGGA